MHDKIGVSEQALGYSWDWLWKMSFLNFNIDTEVGCLVLNCEEAGDR